MSIVAVDGAQRVLETVVVKERNLLLSQNQLLTSRLQHASRDIERLKAKLTQNNELVSHLHTRSIHSVGELEASHAESLALQRRSAGLELELAALAKRALHSETDCKFLEIRNAESKRELADFRDREQQWRAEQAELRRQAEALSDARTLNTTLRAQLEIEAASFSKLSQENEEQTQENENLLQERSGLSQRISELQLAVESEKATLEDFKATMAEDSEQVISALKEYHESVEEGLRRQLSDERKLLEARVQGKEALNEQLGHKCAGLEARHVHLSASLRRLEGQLRDAQTHGKSISGEAEVLLQQKCRLESHLSVVAGNEAQLRGLLDSKNQSAAQDPTSNVQLKIGPRTVWPDVRGSKEEPREPDTGYTAIAKAKQQMADCQRGVHEDLGQLAGLLHRLKERVGTTQWTEIEGDALLRCQAQLSLDVSECFATGNDSQSHGEVSIRLHRCQVELRALRVENEGLLGQRVDAVQKLKHFSEVYDTVLKKSRTRRRQEREKDSAHAAQSREAAARIAELEAEGRRLANQASELASTHTGERLQTASRLGAAEDESRALRHQARLHLDELEQLRVHVEDEKTWKQQFVHLTQQHARTETRLRDALLEVRALIEADVLKQEQVGSLRRDYESLSATIADVASQDKQ